MHETPGEGAQSLSGGGGGGVPRKTEQPEIPENIPGIQATLSAALNNDWCSRAKRAPWLGEVKRN